MQLYEFVISSIIEAQNSFISSILLSVVGIAALASIVAAILTRKMTNWV